MKRSAYERPALVISWKRRLEMGPQVGANIRDESALSRLKHGFESRWGHQQLNQDFPGFLAEFDDEREIPENPRKHPQSPHRMEVKWKWLSQFSRRTR